MKVIVFGATRGVGRQFVEQALEKGYTVTAFARNPAAIKIKSEKLKIMQGDVMNLALVAESIKGHDVVISAIGAPPSSKENVRAQGTQNILNAMENIGLRRFISVSTIGVGDSRVMLPFIYKYILVPLLLKRAFADHERQENYIRKSNLDWTIVRPAALTNGEQTNSYKYGFPLTEKGLKAKISRADVADFLIRQISDKTFIRQTPGLSY